MEQPVRTLYAHSRPVILAHELDFQLGDLTVCPSRLLVKCGGRHERLEPRVMQVLVVLARAEGAVVTRDELIDSCWGGRIVGEDAIQRVLGRIRHLSGEFAGGSFQVETVRGVGCRLVAPQFVAAQAPSPRQERTPILKRATLGAAAAIAIATGIGVYLDKGAGRQAQEASIAVLPFKNMTGGEAYFAEGVAEEIANRLARNAQFKVAGRTSSELFKTATDLRDVGRRLHVDYVLEGSVRSAGEQVRVDVSLVDARQGMRLWSDNYRGTLDDIFAIQDSISRRVAAHVHRELIPPAAPQGTTTTRGDVYSLYLTARGLMGSREPAKLHAAVEMLRQATRLDPDYAPAWAQLAQAMRFEWQRTQPDQIGLDGARRQWLGIAGHALKLAPESADAHLAMCYILSSFTGETTKYEALGKRHCDRAAELAPDDADVLDSIAQEREYEGDFPAALQAYRRLYAVEPLWWHGYGGLTILSWRMGYRDEARQVVDQTARDAKPFSANMIRATLAVEQGDWSEALRLLRAARAVADPAEKEAADRRIALVMRSLGNFEAARAEFPAYEVDDEMWRMWNGRAPSVKRVDELGRNPVALWHTAKMYFLARTLMKEGRSAELLRLYDRRFGSPDELHAIVHGGSPEVVMALRDAGRRAEADRLARLSEADARKIASRGRVPFEFHFERSQFLAVEGRHDEAIAALEKAARLGWFYNNEDYSFRDIGQEPAFRDIKSDPRFQRIRAYFARHAVRERLQVQSLPRVTPTGRAENRPSIG